MTPAVEQVIEEKPRPDFLEVLNSFAGKYQKSVFYTGMFLTLLLSFLLFDTKVSLGGDDSGYMQTAWDFIHKFKFPDFQAPLYPLTLSLFVLIFGFKIVIMKIFSLLCILISMYLFYKSFSKKLPAFLFSVIFILLSINAFLLYYSSQTYSEAFYILVQAIIFWFALRKIEPDAIVNDNWKYYFFLGLILFLAPLSRNVGFGAIGGFFIFYLFQKKKLNVLYLVGGFAAGYFFLALLKFIFIGHNTSQLNSQGNAIFYKDYFNPAKGNEDFNGFVQRFIDNSNLFFSKHFYNLLGFRIGNLEINPLLTIFTWLAFAVTGIWSIFKNKITFLVSAYTLVMCSVTFIALQKQWDQSRMIIIYLPFFLIMVFSLVYFILQIKWLNRVRFLLLIFSLFIFYTTFKYTISKASEQRLVLMHNLSGNKYYGYTPDWVHFFEMSSWVGKNIPKEDKVASRKSSMSFIFSEGREFYSIFKVPMQNVDTSLVELEHTEGNLLYINYYEVGQKRINPSALFPVSKFIHSFFISERCFYITYKIPDSEFQQVSQYISQFQVHTGTSIESFKDSVNMYRPDISVANPDYMVNLLKKNNVKYLMLASLRSNPNFKSGNIINTIHRVAYYIQLKYPDAFESVRKEGADNDEPCELIKFRL